MSVCEMPRSAEARAEEEGARCSLPLLLEPTPLCPPALKPPDLGRHVAEPTSSASHEKLCVRKTCGRYVTVA